MTFSFAKNIIFECFIFFTPTNKITKLHPLPAKQAKQEHDMPSTRTVLCPLHY